MPIMSFLADNPFILAPLAGYTDLAFRLLCREQGAGLCFTEMISCHGMVYQQKNTLVLLRTCPQDRPLGIQLFGSNPEIMGEAAGMISKDFADFIDINMGCPVRKVTRKGAGAALMKDMGLARAIITQVVEKSCLPVTIKCRSGWDKENITAPLFAKMAEDAGAAAVTVHGRTWKQAFSGSADRQVIQQAQQALTIPVIGNGDILQYSDGLQMLDETGCAGVMIGRGALGNPWVFSPHGRPDTLQGRLPVIRRHLELAESYLDVEKMLFRLKNHVGRYLSGLAGASIIRAEIMQQKSFAELSSFFNSF
ncbi:MAG TPA: tRNA dihydrouridine synthase DusB [Desulfobulbaceae bacterium]|nr:tRNA dihydrouridine synthase DusB [Desulfobulbaceae bacterium]